MQSNIITIKIICFIIFINIICNNKKDATTFTGYSIQTKYTSQSTNKFTSSNKKNTTSSPTWIRTKNILIRSQFLYPLRYRTNTISSPSGTRTHTTNGNQILILTCLPISPSNLLLFQILSLVQSFLVI